FGSYFYDPEDNYNQEWRAYIGYHTDAGDFLGLPSGASITIQMPLVFWDAGTMYIASDSASLLATGQGVPNPYNWDPNADRFVVGQSPVADGNGGTTTWVTQSSIPKQNGLPATGRIMFWHNTVGQGISPAAPAQLTEITIRDNYTGTTTTEAKGYFNIPT